MKSHQYVPYDGTCTLSFKQLKTKGVNLSSCKVLLRNANMNGIRHRLEYDKYGRIAVSRNSNAEKLPEIKSKKTRCSVPITDIDIAVKRKFKIYALFKGIYMHGICRTIYPFNLFKYR